MLLLAPNFFWTETLMFQVLDFKGGYHAILVQPCYANFMACPCYVYLKLKIPGPMGIITMHENFKHSRECDIENVYLTEA